MKPFIDRTYRTRPEPAFTALGGSSLGGLVSFGHAAFLGIGAYAAGIVASHGLGSLAIALPAALAASAGAQRVTTGTVLVANKLKSMGYVPIAIDKKATSGIKKELTIPGLSNRVKLKDVQVFSRQFATMLNSRPDLLRRINSDEC